jgi:predicted membrane-bound dolichyl-phosphate-mannose-protein mannosyltransferase
MRPFVSLALCTIAVAVLAGWLALSAFHLRDDYHISHLQGVWLGVVDAASHGQLYPPIFDGEHFAGTRYMPMPILLNALASRVVGDPLVGGKLVAAVLMSGLLAVIVFALRRCSCPWPVALGLAAAVVATDAGLQAGTTIGGDLLPALLQTAALAIMLRARARSSIVLAGLLAGVAIASKLTGVWALFAITTWLVVDRQKRAATIFAAVSLGTAAVILGAVQVLTNGGLTQHLTAFSLAGVHGVVSFFRGPNQVLYNLLGHAF